MSNVRRFTLSNLKKYTSYIVAVQAATKIGLGPVGSNRTWQTKEDIPAKGPVITSIFAESSTSFRIAWKGLSDGNANGAIIGYRVCYKLVETSVNICNSVGNILHTTLFNLEKYTSYAVAVQAATKIGFGPLGAKVTKRTKED
ncbi:sidekick-2 isoform X2, partial [Paramuricea clavata]